MSLRAICVKCLGLLDIDAGELERACTGKSPSTVYASDELAFPGIGVPKVAALCERCGTTVAIAVEPDVAEMVSRYASES